jgi:pterin-4a-carbinolamine dehydratase
MSQVATVHTPTPLQSVRQRLKSERVQEMLQAMPAWRLLPGGQAIDRAFQFPSTRVAATFAEFVSAYAGEEGHTVNLDVSKGEVVLKLAGPKKRGRPGDLTVEIVAFARKLG